MHRMSREKGTVVFLVAVVLVAVGSSFWYVFVRERSSVSDEETFAQEYSLGFVDYDGKEVLLSSFRREVLVAYTWASWCTYCAGELQNLSRLKGTYEDNVQVVAINRGESLSVARDYTTPLGLTGLTLLLDPTDAFFKEIGGYAMPETVFIDSRGKVLFHQRGPIHIEDVKKKIDELLGR